MWPFTRRRKPAVGVQGLPVAAAAEKPERPRSVERHEAVIGRLVLALAKERLRRSRPDRIARYEAELRRHKALLELASGR